MEDVITCVQTQMGVMTVPATADFNLSLTGGNAKVNISVYCMF